MWISSKFLNCVYNYKFTNTKYSYKKYYVTDDCLKVDDLIRIYSTILATKILIRRVLTKIVQNCNGLYLRSITTFMNKE